MLIQNSEKDRYQVIRSAEKQQDIFNIVDTFFPELYKIEPRCEGSLTITVAMFYAAVRFIDPDNN